MPEHCGEKMRLMENIQVLSRLYGQALEALGKKVKKADELDYRRCADFKSDVDTFKELLAVHTCANCHYSREKTAA